MKKIIKKIIKGFSFSWLNICITLGSILISISAFADIEPTLGMNDVGSVALKLQGQASSIKTFLWTAAQVAGVAFSVSAILLWRKISNNKSDKSYGQAFLLFTVGAVGYFLPYAMGTTGSALLAT